jgi:hypothetical protein
MAYSDWRYPRLSVAQPATRSSPLAAGLEMLAEHDAKRTENNRRELRLMGSPDWGP